jgi:CheY-like chemotaxis protein
VKRLAGKRVLVVEDEAIIAMMAEDMLVAMGATVVGPAATLPEAMALARAAEIDVALLDVNLRGDRIDPLAAMLQAMQIPVVLATGYGRVKADLPPEAPVIEKPYTQDRLGAALSAVV